MIENFPRHANFVGDGVENQRRSRKSPAEHFVSTWQGSRNAASMRVGQELKAARKKAGVSVDVVSTRTKVSVSKLVALEKGDFKNLPAGVYLFSIVRAYAREAKIDPEPIVERLRAEFNVTDTLEALTALDKSRALRSNTPKEGQADSRPWVLKGVVIAAGVLLTAIGAGAYLYAAGLP